MRLWREDLLDRSNYLGDAVLVDKLGFAAWHFDFEMHLRGSNSFRISPLKKTESFEKD